VVFSSFRPDTLVRLRRLSPDAGIAVLWSRRRLAPALALARGVRATALHIRKDAAAPAEVDAALAQGLAVRVWTVNDPADSARLTRLGVSGVFTDFPERFLQFPVP
jgi:glycerophosphoryl diester phosphodiesterase